MGAFVAFAVTDLGLGSLAPTVDEVGWTLNGGSDAQRVMEGQQSTRRGGVSINFASQLGVTHTNARVEVLAMRARRGGFEDGGYGKSNNR
jgi:hypothetical protein|tara:strand:+ start:997 stop:1266 length:270 start_codon:yes stop_codon:yes gene_type:complete